MKVPNIGPAQAIYYDVAALLKCCKYIQEHYIQNPIVYILACRIGPFARYFQQKIQQFGGKVYVNPDGHEWMRAKWSAPVCKYWKISEGMMVKHADLLVCDSKNIEGYIQTTYQKYQPNTTFIAYGADIKSSIPDDDDAKLTGWYQEKDIQKKNYYLVVGRFVPENNYETMNREFMNSDTTKDFAIITNVNEKFLDELEQKLQFGKEKRIKFVCTVYEQELPKKIRENAYGYFLDMKWVAQNPACWKHWEVPT